MNPRDRFIRTLDFKPVDKVPMMEIGAWCQTAEIWWKEGLPEDIDPYNMFVGSDYFGLDGIETTDFDVLAPYPRFERRVLEEDEETILFIDTFGRTRKALKVGTVKGQRMSMDQYIDFPVKDRKTFLEIKKRYENTQAARWPQNWDEIKENLKDNDKPLTLLNPMAGTFGYYSMLRNWMGTEGLSYMFYDDSSLVEECLEFLTDYILKFLEKPLSEVKYDLYYIHEDMSFKNGPLVSPKIFKDFFLPHYKKFISFLRSYDVDKILVDTDGNFEDLIPLFLESGVDGFLPMEIASEMHPVELRKKYGKSFSMIGGIDKMEIAKGKKEIEGQIYNVILPMIEEGGFIPTIDHAIPPDVSLENFMYYLDLKRKALEGKL